MQLSTGKVVSANRGIIGIAEDEDVIYEGYDGTVDVDGEPLTKAERLEIAEIMIKRWNGYKDRVLKE